MTQQVGVAERPRKLVVDQIGIDVRPLQCRPAKGGKGDRGHPKCRGAKYTLWRCYGMCTGTVQLLCADAKKRANMRVREIDVIKSDRNVYDGYLARLKRSTSHVPRRAQNDQIQPERQAIR